MPQRPSWRRRSRRRGIASAMSCRGQRFAHAPSSYRCSCSTASQSSPNVLPVSPSQSRLVGTASASAMAAIFELSCCSQAKGGAGGRGRADGPPRRRAARRSDVPLPGSCRPRLSASWTVRFRRGPAGGTRSRRALAGCGGCGRPRAAARAPAPRPPNASRGAGRRRGNTLRRSPRGWPRRADGGAATGRRGPGPARTPSAPARAGRRCPAADSAALPGPPPGSVSTRPPTASAPRSNSRSVWATQSGATRVSPSVEAMTPHSPVPHGQPAAGLLHDETPRSADVGLHPMVASPRPRAAGRRG